MFFAFALIQPDTELLLYFVLPIKVKWLALLDAIYMCYLIVGNFVAGFRMMGMTAVYGAQAQAYGWMHISQAFAVIVAMGHFLLFFFMTRDYKRMSYGEQRRRRGFKKKMKAAGAGQRIVHRCAICGRTQEEFPDLEFRYCSKCEGNYEYCADHLFTHQHVKKYM